MKDKKIAIIGAGISGLSVANLLIENGFTVTVYERNDRPGGLISCSVENGVLFHKVGGHIFNTKNKIVSDWFWNKVDKNDFCLKKRIAKIYIYDKIVGYPIENYLYMLDSKIIKNVINELLSIHKSNDYQEVKNFNDFLRLNFGDTLYSLYFKPYNQKIWKADLSEITLNWLDGKLPMPNMNEIVISNIERKEESEMVHSSFWYPKKDGSQFIANSLADGLDILYNQKISFIERKLDKWIINKVEYDKVIFTGDIRTLSDILVDEVLPREIKDSFIDLKSNGTSNVLCEIDRNNYSWMYFPENKYSIHRIIYTGNFSPSNNGSTKRNTCTIEYSGHLSENKLSIEVKKLPGNIKILAYNYEPNSYIYHIHTTQSIISTAKKNLEAKSFFLLGRFAEWEYYNMDKAIEAAMNLVNRSILNLKH